jgi:hypothetical protein
MSTESLLTAHSSLREWDLPAASGVVTTGGTFSDDRDSNVAIVKFEVRELPRSPTVLTMSDGTFFRGSWTANPEFENSSELKNSLSEKSKSAISHNSSVSCCRPLLH